MSSHDESPSWLPLTELLGRDFFVRNTVDVARDLVGCTLARSLYGEMVSGRIVETEAYGDETDLASHAALYQRSRSEIMRSEPGTVYVYRIYGIHNCFNIVAHEPGSAGAVLIRAVEPLGGLEVMARRRATGVGGALANGPGRLAQAFAFSRGDNGTDVVAGYDITVTAPETEVDVAVSVRIGVSRDAERLWRFYDSTSRHVSRASTPRVGSTDAC